MIWVFRTSVENNLQVRRLWPLLDELIKSASGRWSFDLEDCDKILRIDSSSLDMDRLSYIMTNGGFHCEELPD